MAKEKISILCSSYPPERGAAPSRIYHLATMLAEKGFDVNVICAMPNYPTGKIFEQYKGKLIVHEKLDQVSVSRIWLVPTNSSSKIKRAISLLSYSFSLLTFSYYLLRKNKPDMLIVSSPPFVTGYLGVKIGRMLKVKTLLNLSDIWPQSAVDLGFLKDGVLYRFLKKREQKMYACADGFSVQSEEIKTHIEKLVRHKSTFVYRNIQPALPVSRKPRPEGNRIVVYAGLLGVAQGVFDIIQSINFAELETELHIFGQGNELQKIQNWINQNPGAAVHYKGSFAADKMPEIFCNYHAMLIPLSTQIYGAVPSKIFNAVANGLPVLYSGNGEAGSIVADNKIGFVSDAQDMAGLKRNIEMLIKLEEGDYNLLRQNCFDAAENIFNKEKQDEEFLLFLKEQMQH